LQKVLNFMSAMDTDHAESTLEHATAAPQLHPDQMELQELLSSSPPGTTKMLHLGKDGVLPTLPVNLEAVNTIPLSTRLIKALLDGTIHSQELEDILPGVDGIVVPG
jgi:hypothetical protein